LIVVANLKPAYLLHGDDHGKLAERRANLRGLAQRLGADLEFLEGDRATPDVAAASLAALTLGGEHRVVIVDDIQKWKDKDVAARLVPALAHLDSTTTIAFFAREEKSKVAPPSLIEAVAKCGGDVVKVALPEQKDLAGWVVREAAAFHIELDREAAELIGLRVGRRPSRLTRVLEVLSLGAPPGIRLGAPDVAPFVGDDAELVAWPLVDALVAGNEQQALRLMLELVERGESAIRLLMMVQQRARDLRDLAVRLAAGESRQQVEASVKGPPWARGKRVQEAARADRQWLDALVVRLSALELASRGGAASDPDVMVIHQLFRPPVATAR
jgi:DNA polymerase-3 subunit delta